MQEEHIAAKHSNNQDVQQSFETRSRTSAGVKLNSLCLKQGNCNPSYRQRIVCYVATPHSSEYWKALECLEVILSVAVLAETSFFISSLPESYLFLL